MEQEIKRNLLETDLSLFAARSVGLLGLFFFFYLIGSGCYITAFCFLLCFVLFAILVWRSIEGSKCRSCNVNHTCEPFSGPGTETKSKMVYSLLQQSGNDKRTYYSTNSYAQLGDLQDYDYTATRDTGFQKPSDISLKCQAQSYGPMRFYPKVQIRFDDRLKENLSLLNTYKPNRSLDMANLASSPFKVKKCLRHVNKNKAMKQDLLCLRCLNKLGEEISFPKEHFQETFTKEKDEHFLIREIIQKLSKQLKNRKNCFCGSIRKNRFNSNGQNLTEVNKMEKRRRKKKMINIVLNGKVYHMHQRRYRELLDDGLLNIPSEVGCKLISDRLREQQKNKTTCNYNDSARRRICKKDKMLIRSNENIYANWSFQQFCTEPKNGKPIEESIPESIPNNTLSNYGRLSFD